MTSELSSVLSLSCGKQLCRFNFNELHNFLVLAESEVLRILMPIGNWCSWFQCIGPVVGPTVEMYPSTFRTTDYFQSGR
jgi:hypothetical protein